MLVLQNFLMTSLQPDTIFVCELSPFALSMSFINYMSE